MDIARDTTKKYAPLSLGSVLVLGLGKSGKAASSYCADLLGTRVTSLTVAAGADTPQAREFASGLTQKGVEVLFETYDFEGRYDICIASPGISQFSDFYRAAAASAACVMSEVEFAWRESPRESVWVAITGTNGKTTTTELCAHLLRAAGKRAVAVGNIGDTCLEAVASDAADCYVAEVSSYQLASTHRFAPQVAVLLNITPDHIKWHGSFEEYCRAKCRIYANLASDGGVMVADATNDIVRGYVKEMKALPRDRRGYDYIPVGSKAGLDVGMIEACGSDNAAYCDRGLLTVEYDAHRFELVSRDELQIKGEHNASNALAAASAALALGCSIESVRDGLRSFAPLEHRIEPCGTIAGVRCFNDSKATNVDATLKALSAFGDERPIVLLGGDDKGTDLTELVARSECHGKAVVCFGAAAPRFLEAFREARIPVYEAARLADALDVALSHADSGDIVILSPACASFDEFSCFEERGEVFKQLVKMRADERGA